MVLSSLSQTHAVFSQPHTHTHSNHTHNYYHSFPEAARQLLFHLSFYNGNSSKESVTTSQLTTLFQHFPLHDPRVNEQTQTLAVDGKRSNYTPPIKDIVGGFYWGLIDIYWMWQTCQQCILYGGSRIQNMIVGHNGSRSRTRWENCGTTAKSYTFERLKTFLLRSFFVFYQLLDFSSILHFHSQLPFVEWRINVKSLSFNATHLKVTPNTISCNNAKWLKATISDLRNLLWSYRCR